MAGLPGYEQKKTVGLPLPTQADIAARDANLAAGQRVLDKVTSAFTPTPVPAQRSEVYTGVVQRGLPAAPVASPGYAASPWERNVQAADDRAKQASFDVTNTPVVPAAVAPAAAVEPRMVMPGEATGPLSAQSRGGVTVEPFGAARTLRAPAPAVVAPVGGFTSVGAAPEGPFVDPATSRRAQGTGADKYDLAVKQAYDLQTPFQPNNVFSDSTSGTGDQHLRPTGWNAQTGQVNLPTAPMTGGGAPTFGGMNATQYLASMKAKDAQGRVDANTARLERAREIDMNSARYDIGRAQGINGNRMNGQLYKSANQQLAALEASRVADNLNTTELAKTDALVAGDLQKADIAGSYGLQQADITGRYGMMGDYATAEAAGSVAQAGIDKARIAADGVVRAAGVKNAPTPKDIQEAIRLQLLNNQIVGALGVGNTNDANALLVGQLPPGGKVTASPDGSGVIFTDAAGNVRLLSPSEVEAMQLNRASQL